MESVVLALSGEFMVGLVELRDIVVISERVGLSADVVMLGTISEGFWSIVRGWVLVKLGFLDSCLLGVVMAWVVLGFLVNLDSLVIMLDMRGWVCGRVMLGDVVCGWSCCCFSSTNP